MAEPPPSLESSRLVSLDAYRGFVMIAMASGGLGFANVLNNLEEKGQLEDVSRTVWETLAYEFSHVEWTGCSFWDLIQPSFMFIVGVAMPFSYARRVAKGESFGRMLAHAVYRSIVLVLLAVFLSSNSGNHTNFVFTNVLAQIGLGYTFVFLLLGRGFKIQLAATAAILLGYWAIFRLYAPGADFPIEEIPDKHDYFIGLASHWNKHTNFASFFDLHFLSLFPNAPELPFNKGGYATLNFVPSMATMLCGVMAGQSLLSDAGKGRKILLMTSGALACFAVGMAIDHTIWPDWLVERAAVDPDWSLCPIVKRIWTPSWAVFSSGWTLLLLALFYTIIDCIGLRFWAFPLVVVGMNSIVMYMMSQLLKPWVKRSLQTHIRADLFDGTFGPLVERCSVLLILWLFCLWLYRQRLFVRI